MSSSRRSIREGLLGHGQKSRNRIGRHRLALVGEIRYGPSGLPEAATFEEAFAALAARGLPGLRVRIRRRFWLDYETAPLLGEAAVAADVALSVHAPLAAFMGHADRGKKFKMALGMLDHTAGPRPGLRRAADRLPSRLPARPRAGAGRSPTSSTSSATCASGWRRRTGSSPSASR